MTATNTRNRIKQRGHRAIQRDDSLYGLLSVNKANNTYIRILESERKKVIVVQITDNPKNWQNIPKDQYTEFKSLSRLEIGVSKISLKYLSPQNLVHVLGPYLGFKIPGDKVVVINSINSGGYYIIEASLKYKSKVLQGVKKIINLSPQKRYEILEKSLSNLQD